MRRAIQLLLVPILTSIVSCTTVRHNSSADFSAIVAGEDVYLADIPGSLIVVFTLNASMTMTYIDIPLENEGLRGSYVRTVPYELRDGNRLCVIREKVDCFDFPVLSENVPATVNVSSYGENGAVTWQGQGSLLLLESRPPFRQPRQSE
jgi:hypothetical protein